jgi:hypothetical protein
MDENEFEHAERLAAAQVERGLALARKSRGTPPVGWDGRTCAECGEDVAPQRLTLGYFVCVECRTLKERRGED